MGLFISKSASLPEILQLAPPCSCEDCGHGCTMGSGFLAEGDKEKLAAFLGISVQSLEKEYLEETYLFNKKVWKPKLLREGKPYGKCVFYENGCKVHPSKPLQCKVAMGCKEYGEELQLWFMLNHLIDKEDPESVRQFAQYLKAGGKTLPGGELNDLVPDKKQLREILSYERLR
ncbi:YkgJ family cysteine cluster protein [Candidatus Woesearchaeota archaeon]|nr:YkgJ family cysteine cluster protein [Candidatus Woesearchaeota archaeon]